MTSTVQPIVYNRWIDATGAHALSDEAHRQGATRTAQFGIYWVLVPAMAGAIGAWPFLGNGRGAVRGQTEALAQPDRTYVTYAAHSPGGNRSLALVQRQPVS